VCGDPAVTLQGNAQFDWINETMHRWEDDPSIVWKATTLHHPMWGKWYPDFANIVSNYLPLLQEFNFDLYFNGHEHVISYAHYNYTQVPKNYAHVPPQWMHYELSGYECYQDLESFFGSASETTRRIEFKKGEALHQVNTGMSGFDSYSLCLDRPTMGTFTYAQNVYKAFTQVHVQEDLVTIKSRGVEPTFGDVYDLYELVITNDVASSPDELLTN